MTSFPLAPEHSTTQKTHFREHRHQDEKGSQARNHKGPSDLRRWTQGEQAGDKEAEGADKEDPGEQHEEMAQGIRQICQRTVEEDEEQEKGKKGK